MRNVNRMEWPDAPEVESEVTKVKTQDTDMLDAAVAAIEVSMHPQAAYLYKGLPQDMKRQFAQHMIDVGILKIIGIGKKD